MRHAEGSAGPLHYATATPFGSLHCLEQVAADAVPALVRNYDERGDAAAAAALVEERRDMQAGHADDLAADLGHQDRVGVGHGRDPRSKLDRACGYPSSTSSPASAGASAGRAVRSSIGPAEAACLAVRGFEDRHAGIGPAANASPPISEGSVNLHRAAEMGPPQDP